MTDNKTAPAHPYGFGPLVEECARRGISKTIAFELVKEGHLSTFTIGRKRYVRIPSLESLPDRLSGDAQGSAGKQP